MWDQQWETIDSEADIVIRIKQNGYGRLYKHKCCNKGALQYACYGYGRAKLIISGCRQQQAGRCTVLYCYRSLHLILMKISTPPVQINDQSQCLPIENTIMPTLAHGKTDHRYYTSTIQKTKLTTGKKLIDKKYLNKIKKYFLAGKFWRVWRVTT